MQNISRHISYLLLTCRKVYVPGLGSFSASYTKANFDSDFGVFYPSGIRISYNHDQQDSSLILMDSLKRKFKIKENEAKKLVNDFVVSVNKILQKNHYCRLEGIGYLFYKNGDIYFKDTFWKKNRLPFLSSISV